MLVKIALDLTTKIFQTRILRSYSYLNASIGFKSEALRAG